MNQTNYETTRKGSPSFGRGGIPNRARHTPTLAEILRTARAESGLHVRQVATETGVSTGSISQIEQGKSQKPTLDTLLALSEVYGLDPMELIEAAGYKLKPSLPDFQPYLRQKYRHLPDNAQEELTQAFERITHKYGITNQSGPAEGEDETE